MSCASTHLASLTKKRVKSHPLNEEGFEMAMEHVFWFEIWLEIVVMENIKSNMSEMDVLPF